VKPLEPAPDTAGANVIDLTQLLKSSLRGKAASRAPAAKVAGRRIGTTSAKRRRARVR